MMISWQQF